MQIAPNSVSSYGPINMLCKYVLVDIYYESLLQELNRVVLQQTEWHIFLPRENCLRNMHSLNQPHTVLNIYFNVHTQVFFYGFMILLRKVM
jgi:hypothetical protein